MSNNNDIYYFLGNITSHILHALLLHKELGGTFIVTSNKARREIERLYGVPVINVNNKPYKWMRPGLRPKRIHEYTTLYKSLKETYNLLNNAKIVIFYELFELEKPEWLNNPRKIFLTHGNMLKSYMTMHPRRLSIVQEYDYIAALSPYMKQKFIEDGIPKEKLLDIGVARTDELIQALKNKHIIRQDITSRLGLNSEKPIILYAPTFWGDSSVYNTGLQIVEQISREYSLIFRPHPQTPKRLLNKYKSIIKLKNNVKLVDHHSVHIPLTHLLVVCDAAIVDRSSLVLEAILTTTPIIFAYNTERPQYTTDYKSISEIVNYSDNITLNDNKGINYVLANSLQKGIDNKIWHVTRRQVWFQPRGGATKAIAQHIHRLLGEGPKGKGNVR